MGKHWPGHRKREKSISFFVCADPGSSSPAGPVYGFRAPLRSAREGGLPARSASLCVRPPCHPDARVGLDLSSLETDRSPKRSCHPPRIGQREKTGGKKDP